MTDKIEITREEFEAFRKHTTLECYVCWDDFKAFVEKERAPKRREFHHIHSITEYGSGGLHHHNIPVLGQFLLKEVLPGDIGPMTKAEAREWVSKAWKLATTTSKEPNPRITLILKALGLTE